MLRRDRLIRMQIHELLDACLFALSFWLAYWLRSDPNIQELFNLDPIEPSFNKYLRLYLVLLPAAPMVLEAQGFYNRPVLCRRRTTAWLLFKGCLITSLGLILALFLFRTEIARAVPFWFGVISFALVFTKEELLLLVFRSQLAKAQYRRRFILVGTGEETARMRAELKAKSPEALDIIAELKLDEISMQRLVELLHEHSVNGVIISAKRTFFDEVETAIRACELEGVEV